MITFLIFNHQLLITKIRKLFSILYNAGLRNGDRVVRINGLSLNELESPELDLKYWWQNATLVNIDLLRQDQEVLVTLKVE
mgnify:CR=1 FL=1